MYHPTEMANALTPSSLFYSLYTPVSPNQNQRDYPSRLEISFLLDSGASNSVLKYPTYVTNVKLLNIKQNNPHNSSKTLTVTNQTEVPTSHYVTLTSNTTIEDDSSIYNTFCSSRHKIHILGTPFFEENIQNINIQDFTFNLRITLEYTQTIQNSLHFYPKIIHISHISIESFLKHTFV